MFRLCFPSLLLLRAPRGKLYRVRVRRTRASISPYIYSEEPARTRMRTDRVFRLLREYMERFNSRFENRRTIFFSQYH